MNHVTLPTTQPEIDAIMASYDPGDEIDLSGVSYDEVERLQEEDPPHDVIVLSGLALVIASPLKITYAVPLSPEINSHRVDEANNLLDVNSAHVLWGMPSGLINTDGVAAKGWRGSLAILDIMQAEVELPTYYHQCTDEEFVHPLYNLTFARSAMPVN